MAAKTKRKGRAAAARSEKVARSGGRRKAASRASTSGKKAPSRSRSVAKKSAARRAASGLTGAKRSAPRATPVAPRKLATKPTKPVRKPVAKAAAKSAASALKWTDTLSDGTHVIIRPIATRDASVEREFIERLSPESRRLRFLGQISAPTDEMVRHFVDIDYDRDMAFVALVHRDNKTREIGVSRYSRSSDGASCECAVAVSDEWRHRGLATLLMRHLIDFARSQGIRSMLSYDAVENTEMRMLADALGFTRRNDPDDLHMVIHRLAL